jgi:hypothetical protein
MARLILLALAPLAARALQPLSPCRATRRRHLVSVRAEPEPDVDELKRQAEALRAEVETLQAEAQAAREEELRRNPPPPPKPVRERPKPVKRKTEEDEGFALPSFNLFGGDDDAAQKKKQPVTDDEVELASKALACLPYLLPMSDAIPFGQYVINDFPLIALPLLPFAPFVALLNAIPFGGFIVFIGLSTGSRNPQFPRFVRFSMQQAVLLDIALIFPQLFQSIFGATNIKVPEALVEPASSFVFFFIFVAALYSCGSNALGKQPNQIPIISSAAEQSIGPF